VIGFGRPRVPFEQAVYGSFPFWDRGYALLGQSAGCRPEWIEALKLVGQRLGERSRGDAPSGGLIYQRLPDGTAMIIRPAPQGRDDRGRPDALAFHGLFVSPRAFRKARENPFRLLDAFRAEWTQPLEELPAGRVAIRSRPSEAEALEPFEVEIVEALNASKRVVVVAPGPIDALAAKIWPRLPKAVRQRATLATWCHTDTGTFDWIGLPRTTSVDPSDSNLLITPIEQPCGSPGPEANPKPEMAGLPD